MDQLKQMKEMLTGVVQGQMTHLENVDTKELGEAIDMIKDLAEAIYYCTVSEAMEEKEKEWNRETMYYPVMYYEEGSSNNRGNNGRRNYEDNTFYDRDTDWMKGRMYYNGNGNSSGSSSSGNSGTRNYSERDLGAIMRDSREGRSPMSRKNYMESKAMHKDKASQLQELEKYMQELSSDMAEMIEDASPEEKQLLSNKISALAAKIK